MKTFASVRRFGAVVPFVLLVAAGTVSARPIVGGGVLVDRDPNNDTVVGAAYYFNALHSDARVGIGTFGPSDSTDYYGWQMPANTVVTAMTIPLSSPTGPFLTPGTSVLLSSGDGTIQHVNAGSGGTDQSGSTPNSGGSVARARPAAGGNQKVRIASGESGSYAVLVSVYTGDGGDFEEQEPNNGPAFPLVLGLRMGGPMIGMGALTAGDVDYYAVDMKKGEVLGAVTTPVENFPTTIDVPDTVMDVIDTNGAAVLVTNDDAGSDQTGTARGSAVRYRAVADGRYFLRVRGFNASAAGKYALTAVLLAPPPGTECIADFNGDGVVNTNDLVTFLGRFGQPCP